MKKIAMKGIFTSYYDTAMYGVYWNDYYRGKLLLLIRYFRGSTSLER